jgi:hypothetical protein
LPSAGVGALAILFIFHFDFSLIGLVQPPAGLAKLSATALAVLRFVPPCRLRAGFTHF